MKIALISNMTPAAENVRGTSALPFHILIHGSKDVEVDVYSLANNQFWREANIYHSLTKTSKIFWYLSKYRLFYMFDSLLLLITRIHDR